MKRKTLLAGLGAAGIAGALPRRGIADQERATIVFRNGVVYTSRKDGAIAEAVAVGGNRILAVGSRATIDGYIGPSTRVVDLKGGMLLPGFIDTHTHFVSGSLARTQVDLDDAESPDEVVQTPRCVGAGTSERSVDSRRQLAVRRFPADRTADERTPRPRDSGSPRRAGCVRRTLAVAGRNSKALALAGITRSTADPVDNGIGVGTIVRDASGEPTGVFKEMRAGYDPVAPFRSRRAMRCWRRSPAGWAKPARGA